ncbi:hypothetical protein [Deinococcus sp. QL22]|uniref:hypothetical protein n=1 Tax=Deinococcus sp. QL22 TaxID=2939437 RepID=UPI002017C566|nr:hypothetical protein [Deinococcus sp. QL22]UQN06781.1 hypothetical protein M1R55_02335 [Deinococcus sp. QL22]
MNIDQFLTDGLTTIAAQTQFYRVLSNVSEAIEKGRPSVKVVDLTPDVIEALTARRLSVRQLPKRWANLTLYEVTW